MVDHANLAHKLGIARVRRIDWCVSQSTLAGTCDLPQLAGCTCSRLQSKRQVDAHSLENLFLCLKAECSAFVHQSGSEHTDIWLLLLHATHDHQVVVQQVSCIAKGNGSAANLDAHIDDSGTAT